MKTLFNHNFTFSLFAFASLLSTGCEITPYGVAPVQAPCQGVDIQCNLGKLKDLEQSKLGQRSFKVAIISDSHENTNSLALAVTRINQRSDIDFVMILGDLTDNGLKIQYEYAITNLKKLNKPVMAVIGNHDSLSNGKELWTTYFGKRRADESVVFDGYNYSFSYLGTKFIAYNDNAFEFANVPDQGFIQREAALQPGEIRNHTIAASHVQPNSEVHDATFQAAFLKMLADAQVHMTIHGHRHDFFYDKDKYGNDHHVVSWTKDGDWSVMTVDSGKITMENCTNNACGVVAPR